MLNKKPITEQGRAVLTRRLERLRAEMPLVIEEIAEANKKGDRSENFEYHAAKRRRDELDRETQDLDEFLKSTAVFKLPTNPSMVCFGCKVALESNGNHVQYVVVGDREADVERGSISIGSPLFQAMLGKKAGTAVSVNGKEYLIESVMPVTAEDIESVIVQD